jgi:hypothetical protein
MGISSTPNERQQRLMIDVALVSRATPLNRGARSRPNIIVIDDIAKGDCACADIHCGWQNVEKVRSLNINSDSASFEYFDSSFHCLMLKALEVCFRRE